MAWRFLRRQGIAAARVAVGGDSAGGSLTAALINRLRASGDEKPACAWLVSPWIDLTMSGSTLSLGLVRRISLLAPFRAGRRVDLGSHRPAGDAAGFLAGRAGLGLPLVVAGRDLPSLPVVFSNLGISEVASSFRRTLATVS